MPYGYQIQTEEPLTRKKHNARAKGHTGVIRGQPAVKLLEVPYGQQNNLV